MVDVSISLFLSLLILALVAPHTCYVRLICLRLLPGNYIYGALILMGIHEIATMTTIKSKTKNTTTATTSPKLNMSRNAKEKHIYNHRTHGIRSIYIWFSNLAIIAYVQCLYCCHFFSVFLCSCFGTPPVYLGIESFDSIPSIYVVGRLLSLPHTVNFWKMNVCATYIGNRSARNCYNTTHTYTKFLSILIGANITH